MTTIHSRGRAVTEADPHPVVVIAADGPAARRAAIERAGVLFGPGHEQLVVGTDDHDVGSACDVARRHRAVGLVLGVTVGPGDRGRAPWVVRAVRDAPCPVIVVVEEP